VIECRKKADVVFVIDSTSNLQEKDFQLYILGTVGEIIEHLDVDLGGTRVAVVYFTNTAKVCISTLYTVSQKNWATFIFIVTLSNVGRF